MSPHHPDHLLANPLRLDVEVQQDACCYAFVLAHQPEQDVLSASSLTRALTTSSTNKPNGPNNGGPDKTIYAEYPSVKPRLEQLDQQKTEQTVESLAQIWGCSDEEALTTADHLAEIGFFERRGDRERFTFWVPFLYRDALRMIQGSTDPIAGVAEDVSGDD
ncbi:MAG: hypothetical protein ABSC56_03150 [Solirubrobacteraceae bacterium]|jgi:hypothetical protein